MQAILTVQRMQWGVLFLALGVLYFSLLREMAGDWAIDPNYSHGYLIPFIAAYFLWQRREKLLEIEPEPASAGLLVMGAGLGMFFLGDLAAEYFTMRFSFLVVLAGIVLVLAGWAVLRLVVFPLGYLIFMIPLPYTLYDSIAFPLKLFAAKAATAVLQIIWIPIHREGNILILENQTLEVADACSGIRSLVSLLALGVAMAAMFQRTTPRRIALVAAAVPIALFVNVLRIVVTGLLTHYVGPEAALGFFHEFEGMVVFAVALVMLFGTNLVLDRMGRKAEL
ncbi:MAG: exosortase/archaeosortase family protein [Nitrospirae bacterium]|nr:exosortase/archaeosortase family protein [Nitrospirota bacterium]